MSLLSFPYLFIFSHWIFTVVLGLSSGMWILVPWPGIEPSSPALKGGFLSTGPPGKSPSLFVLMLKLPEVCPALGWLLLTYTLSTSLSCGTGFSRLHSLLIIWNQKFLQILVSSLPPLPLGEWYLEAKTLALRVLIDTRVLMLSGHLSRQKVGRVQQISFFFI